jgi:hypothetical protein
VSVLRRFGLLLAVVLAAGVVTLAATTQAEAATGCQTRYVTAPDDPGNIYRQITMQVCKADGRVGDFTYDERVQVWIGSYATRATGCSVSLWSTLYRNGFGWNGPSTVQRCDNALRQRDTYKIYFNSDHWHTTAGAMEVHACITLFYGATKGAPICQTSHVVGV